MLPERNSDAFNGYVNHYYSDCRLYGDDKKDYDIPFRNKIRMYDKIMNNTLKNGWSDGIEASDVNSLFWR